MRFNILIVLDKSNSSKLAIQETQEKAKNLSRGRKLHFGLSTGLYLGLSILFMFALFGIIFSIYPGLYN